MEKAETKKRAVDLCPERGVATIADLLRQGRAQLRAAQRPADGLDARLLLQEAGSLSHEEIILYPDRVLERQISELYRSLIERRSRGEPVARIVGYRQFYRHDFMLSPFVLDPRPESEALLEVVLDFARAGSRHKPRLLELGVGSGAILLSLLSELPTAQGVGVDCSALALETTRFNAVKLSVMDRLCLQQANWFDAADGQFDVILTNPPYIKHAELAHLDLEVRLYDPILALDGGLDGLDAYRQIAQKAADFLKEDGLLAVEIGAGQEQAVTQIFEEKNLVKCADHYGLEKRVRCLSFSRA